MTIAAGGRQAVMRARLRATLDLLGVRERRSDISGRAGVFPLTKARKGRCTRLGEALVRVLRMEHRFTVYTDAGPVEGAAGDYLVEYEDGSSTAKRELL